MRSTAVSASMASSAGASASPARAALSAGRPRFQPARPAALTARSRRRPGRPRAGRKPGPNGGRPSAGTTSIVVLTSATGTPADSPAITEPPSIASVTIASAGRRSSSSSTSRATSAARPNISRSRMRAKAPNGVRASQSLNRSDSAVRSVRWGARVHVTGSAPVAAISGTRTGSPSTRTSWPRSTSARTSERVGGTAPPPSHAVNRKVDIGSVSPVGVEGLDHLLHDRRGAGSAEPLVAAEKLPGSDVQGGAEGEQAPLARRPGEAAQRAGEASLHPVAVEAAPLRQGLGHGGDAVLHEQRADVGVANALVVRHEHGHRAADVVRLGAAAGLLDGRAETLDCGDEQPFLAAEVVHHGLERHARRRGHVAQGHVVVPTLEEQLDSRVHDAPARGVRGGGPGGLPVGPDAHFRWTRVPFTVT